MTESISTMLDLLGQFTGGRGGSRYLVVNYAIAASFWGALAAVARSRAALAPSARHLWCRNAFLLGASRDVMMVAVVALQTSHAPFAGSMLTWFPPFEHTVRDITEVVLAAALVVFVSGDERFARAYAKTGATAMIACWLATAYWWWVRASDDAALRFDTTWCDWLFRAAISVLLAAALAAIARAPRSDARALSGTAVALLLAYQALKLADMATAGAFESVFNPVRRWGYLGAVLVVAYAYARDVGAERTRRARDMVLRLDVLERRSRDLEAEKIWARAALNAVQDVVLVCTTDGTVAYLNASAEAALGCPTDGAVGHPIVDLIGRGEEPAETRALIDEALRTREFARHSVRSRGNGSDDGDVWFEEEAAPIFDAQGSVAGIVFTRKDVTSARKMAAKIVHQAHHDPLTGLPNRVLLTDRIDQAVRLGARHGRPVALLFVDLDRLKSVNDTQGHATGDAVLKHVAAKLKGAVRATDTVSRIGGDEFVVLIPEIDDTRDAARLAEKLLHALSNSPFAVDSREIPVAASVGIAVYPDDASDSDGLIRAADAAMYHAKEAGRGTYRYFTPALRDLALARLALEADLRNAVQRDELFLEYQPKVGISSGRVIGCEALVRWNRPGHGVVGPDDFIGVAEKCGLIDTIGEWVLVAGCRQNRAWQDAGLPPLPISVNVSGVQFSRSAFVRDVDRVLYQTGLAPWHLELELTESSLMENSEQTRSTLAELKRSGIRISVDDFGTGYSSLSYLRLFPIDCIKIDRSFMQDVGAESERAAILRTIVNLAQNLGLESIAEGVETRTQREYLAAIGCDGIQGFLAGEPMSAESMAAVLRAESVLA